MPNGDRSGEAPGTGGGVRAASSGGAPDDGRLAVTEKELSDDHSEPRRSGRALGLLALLLALGALGIGAYLYYELIHLAPQAGLEARLVETEVRLQEDSAEISALAGEQRRALDEFAAEQRREREASAKQLLEAVNELASQAPPSRREWKVAEVAYLLRIANHRLLMERDAAGALTLLRAADAILVELDDFSLYQVRAQLADEILSLEHVQTEDMQGLFLRLEAIKTEVGRQRLRLPHFDTPDEPAAPDSAWWQSLIRELGGYLRFRRFDGATVKPLLAPEEAAYLELNLRLMLERAQLAALRRDELIYQQSLETAGDWISSYLDAEDPGVKRSLDELRALSQIDLVRPLPDISGSLKTLQSLGEA